MFFIYGSDFSGGIYRIGLLKVNVIKGRGDFRWCEGLRGFREG